MKREELFKYAFEAWGVLPDHPFRQFPECAVLRHGVDGKWFAVVMPVPFDRLDASKRGESDIVDVVNLKCQPPLVTMFLEREGVFPAYHMNRRHWVSIVLDSSFPGEELFELLSLSRKLTAGKRRGC
ncbi:MAG: MmcQ/YjbR family DNA-binding protein [Mailhella sp.]|nr:MmcQ/YjbR family DNA-binding protein [Mailhella sp.]